MIKNLGRILIILVTIIFFKCKNEVKKDFITFKSESLLKGDTLHFDPSPLFPARIIVLDTILIVQDRKNDKYFYNYDKTKLKLFNSFGIKGKGPGEMLSTWSYDVDSSKKVFWSFDLMLIKYNAFLFDDILSQKESIAPHKIINLKHDTAQIYNPVFLTENVIASPGFFGGARLVYFDTLGNLTSKSGLFPKGKSKEVPDRIHAHAFQANLTKNDIVKKFVLANRYTDLLEFYNYSGDFLSHIQGPIGNTPDYKLGYAGENIMLDISEENRFGYIDVCSSDKYIFALFSGYSMKESPKESFYGRFIFVFDWNGNPIHKFVLEEFLITISIDIENHCIYGVQEYPVSKIIKYNVEL